MIKTRNAFCSRKDSGNSPYMLQLKVDDVEAFDYEQPENAKYNVHDIKQMLIDEILKVQKESVV